MLYGDGCVLHASVQSLCTSCINRLGEKRWSFILLDVINLSRVQMQITHSGGDERNIISQRLAPTNLYVSTLVAALLIYLFAYLLQQLLIQSSLSCVCVCATLGYIITRFVQLLKPFPLVVNKNNGGLDVHTYYNMRTVEKVKNVSGRN